jgi:hypothetical protein
MYWAYYKDKKRIELLFGILSQDHVEDLYGNQGKNNLLGRRVISG